MNPLLQQLATLQVTMQTMQQENAELKQTGADTAKPYDSTTT